MTPREVNEPTLTEFKGEPKWKCKLASKFTKCANISIFTWLFYQYLCNPPPPPPPPTELLRAQSGWSNPYQGQKKGWLVTHLILLPHMPALFKRSLKQTAGPKMAARTAMFSQLSNVHFFHQQDGESVPKPAAYFFFFIPLFQQGLWCFFGLVPL